MRFQELAIKGVWRIEPESHEDERGLFRRHFCVAEFKAHGLEAHIEQGNVSENYKRHTLRGFHYQEAPRGEARTVSCLRGKAQFVLADLRVASATYLKTLAIPLNEDNRWSLHVPVGCALAFLSLEDKTILHYYMSRAYAQYAYKGVRHNDPAFKIDWGPGPFIISKRDQSWPNFVPQKAQPEKPLVIDPDVVLPSM